MIQTKLGLMLGIQTVGAVSFNSQIFYFPIKLWVSVVKISKILSPIPAPKFGDFRGFSPKNPRNLNDPCPQTIPKPFGSSVPIPIPENWGFSGINPKNPQNWSHPRPQKIPNFFQRIVPVPAPSPKFQGGDGENRGLGPCFTIFNKGPSINDVAFKGEGRG